MSTTVSASCPICRRAIAPEVVAHARGPVGSVPEALAASVATFPFCSRRCKLADLGAWFEGQYRIPGESLASERDDASTLEALRLLSDEQGEA